MPASFHCRRQKRTRGFILEQHAIAIVHRGGVSARQSCDCAEPLIFVRAPVKKTVCGCMASGSVPGRQQEQASLLGARRESVSVHYRKNGIREQSGRPIGAPWDCICERRPAAVVRARSSSSGAVLDEDSQALAVVVVGEGRASGDTNVSGVDACL